jgi:uncharacterized protein YkwD
MISVAEEPLGYRFRHVPAPEVAARLQAFLNPAEDPYTDQRCLAWRQEYNRYRHLYNLDSAPWVVAFALVCQWKAEDMRARDYFSHQTPEGYWLWDLCRMAGVTPPGYIGECIGYGYREAPGLLAAYDASPTHRQVLRDDRYTHQGVGHAQLGIESSVYWCNGFLGGLAAL